MGRCCCRHGGRAMGRCGNWRQCRIYCRGGCFNRTRIFFIGRTLRLALANERVDRVISPHTADRERVASGGCALSVRGEHLSGGALVALSSSWVTERAVFAGSASAISFSGVRAGRAHQATWLSHLRISTGFALDTRLSPIQREGACATGLTGLRTFFVCVHPRLAWKAT